MRPDFSMMALRLFRRDLKISLVEAKQRLAGLPFVVRSGVRPEEASAIAAEYEALGVEAEVSVVKRVRNRTWDPAKPDRLLVVEPPLSGHQPWTWREAAVTGVRRGPHGKFEIALQACPDCGAVGTLVSEGPGRI